MRTDTMTEGGDVRLQGLEGESFGSNGFGLFVEGRGGLGLGLGVGGGEGSLAIL